MRGNDITDVLKKYTGELPLWIPLKTATTGEYRVKVRKYKVSADPKLVRDLRKILGKENVGIG